MTDSNNISYGCFSWNNRCVNKIYEHLHHADAPLAMGYVPYQSWNTTFDPCQALKTGTLFPALYKPFCGKGGRH